MSEYSSVEKRRPSLINVLSKEKTSFDTFTDESSKPSFKGYLSLKTGERLSRWKTRYFNLSGKELKCLSTRDGSIPIKLILLDDYEIVEKVKKLQIILKKRSKKIKLKALDKNEFDCWVMVLKRAKSWKGSGRIVSQSEEIKDFGQMDLESEMEDLFLDETVDENEDNLDKIREKHREVLLKKMTELKALHHSLSSEPLFAFSEKHDKKKRNDLTNPQRLLLLSSEMLGLFAHFLGIVENERDIYKNKYLAALGDNKQLERSLKILAKQHHKMEKEATMNGFPSAAQVVTEDDSSDEFFDAVDHKSSSSDEEEVFIKKSIERPKTSPVNTIRVVDSATFVHRTRLPADGPKKRPGFWSILKNNIGKDLSKISMPILFNEPISALQKWSEDNEYCTLLDMATSAENDLLRLAYVAVFHASNYSGTMYRLYKPFNPILGETFEYSRNDIGGGFTYVSEQVSHHPPVSACHTIGNKGWEYYTTVQVTNSFKGKDLEIYPLGVSHVKFKDGTHITFQRVTTVVRNIIVGSMWVDNYGDSKIKNHKTGDVCTVKFKPYSIFGGKAGDLEGEISDSSGNPVYIIKGNWSESISLQDCRSNVTDVVWKRNPLPPHASAQYEFTTFTMALNELEPNMVGKIAPTDSRFRPDMRLYEEGNVQDAQSEKERLEEKQRSARRLREATGETYKPIFFSLEFDQDLNKDIWTFKESEYNRRKSASDWKDFPDLFS